MFLCHAPAGDLFVSRRGVNSIILSFKAGVSTTTRTRVITILGIETHLVSMPFIMLE